MNTQESITKRLEEIKKRAALATQGPLSNMQTNGDSDSDGMGGSVSWSLPDCPGFYIHKAEHEKQVFDGVDEELLIMSLDGFNKNAINDTEFYLNALADVQFLLARIDELERSHSG